eukprot:scaffold12839_cov111-Phaeocystis_antarctica.AAC.1
MIVGAAAALWLSVRWGGVLYAEEAHPFDVGHSDRRDKSVRCGPAQRCRRLSGHAWDQRSESLDGLHDLARRSGLLTWVQKLHCRWGHRMLLYGAPNAVESAQTGVNIW